MGRAQGGNSQNRIRLPVPVDFACPAGHDDRVLPDDRWHTARSRAVLGSADTVEGMSLAWLLVVVAVLAAVFGLHELRRAFGRLGVPVLCAAEGEAVRLVLDRMERLRLAGRRRP